MKERLLRSRWIKRGQACEIQSVPDKGLFELCMLFFWPGHSIRSIVFRMRLFAEELQKYLND
ncbi:MAG: hypothetical protein DWH94_04535 [Planctomycetota bacterium]|nr:MAG: hypothetical protein DWH94_04535 [Planctomycetota bacterium]